MFTLRLPTPNQHDHIRLTPRGVCFPLAMLLCDRPELHRRVAIDAVTAINTTVMSDRYFLFWLTDPMYTQVPLTADQVGNEVRWRFPDLDGRMQQCWWLREELFDAIAVAIDEGGRQRVWSIAEVTVEDQCRAQLAEARRYAKRVFGRTGR